MANTTLWSVDKGQLTFPITPTSIDGINIGATTPGTATFTNVTTTGLGKGSVTAGITAGTTHTLAGATALPSKFNQIGTVAVSADAVALPSATAALVGAEIFVINDGAQPAAIWPQVADAIDGGTAGAAVTCTNAKRAIFVCIAANTWSSLGAVKSA